MTKTQLALRARTQVLHARSSEKEETGICSDLRGGKLRYVIVAESGKIGCGDPLWNMREYAVSYTHLTLPTRTRG